MSTSVSKGVFVHKGRKVIAKKDILPSISHSMDNKDLLHSRMKLHDKFLHFVQENVDIIQKEINSKLFNDVTKYLSNSYETFKNCQENVETSNSVVSNTQTLSSNSGSHTLQLLKTSSFEIPAAALVLGINKQDHDLIFIDLIKNIIQTLTTHVVSLKSVKCNSLKTLINSLIIQLTQQQSMDDSDIEDEEVNIVLNRSMSRKRSKRVANMSVVLEWYDSLKTSVNPSPSKALSAFNDLSIITPHKKSLDVTYNTDKTSVSDDTKHSFTALKTRKSPRKLNTPLKNSFVQSHKNDNNELSKGGSFKKGLNLDKENEVLSTPLKKRDLNVDSIKKFSKKFFTPIKTPVLSPPKSARRSARLSMAKTRVTNYSLYFKDGFSDADSDNNDDNSVIDEDYLTRSNKDEEEEEEEEDESSTDSNIDSISDSSENGNESSVEKNQEKLKLKSLKDYGLLGIEEVISLKKAHQKKYEDAPIVIIFEDLESFNTTVLQDFICILSNYRERLPIFLVFGVSTNVSYIHTSFPRSSIALLSIQPFYSLPSSQHLSILVDKLCLDAKTPFRLGSREYNFLLDCFLYNDFSIQSFVKSYKLSLLHHLLSNPASILLQFHGTSFSPDNISDEHLDPIRSVPSFRKYVEAAKPKEQIKLLEDNQHTKKVIVGMLQRLNAYHCNFFLLFHCLHSLTSSMTSFPLGKLPRELYGMCLQNSIYKTQAYNRALTILRSMSKAELISSLSKMLDALETYSTNTNIHIGSFNYNLNESLSNDERSKFKEEVKKTITSFIKELNLYNESNRMEVSTEGKGADLKERLKRRMSMSALKQALKENSEVVSSGYTSLRNNIVQQIDSLFSTHMHHYKDLSLHEVIYSDNLPIFKSSVLPAPSACMHRALNRPSYYLDIPKQSNIESISSDLPDLSIVYKLHLECGKFINLYDWMQAFSSIVNGGDDDHDDSTVDNVDKLTNARFVRAVSELQFLGLIKATNKKFDHVTRLTWSVY